MTEPRETGNPIETEPLSAGVSATPDDMAAGDTQKTVAAAEVTSAELQKTAAAEVTSADTQKIAATVEVTSVELQKTATENDPPYSDGDSVNEPLMPFSLTFKNHEPELIQAGTVVDEQGRSKGHRSFQILGVFLLLWMFVPNVLKDPTDFMSLLMVLAAFGLLWVVLKYPAQINAKFAKQRAEATPECTVELTNAGMTVVEGSSSYDIDFSGKVAAYDYMDGITIHAENNRIVCIPKKQLSEAELFSLRAALRQGLGDRFSTIEVKPPQGLFGRPK